MKKLILIIPILAIVGCSNEVEEIVNSTTGIVLKKYEYYTDDSGQKVKDGTYTEWNPDGSIKWTCNYEDGKQQGEEMVYLKADSIVYNNYEKDLRSGRSRIEYKNVVIRDLSYLEGNLNGKQKYCFPNGMINVVGFMKDNKTTGTWKHYDQAGNITATFTYNINGAPNELIGKWVQENDNGKEVFYVFDELGFGEFHEPLFRYSKSSVLQMEGFYQLGKNLILQDGVNIIIIEIVSFKNDKLIIRHLNGDIEVYNKSQ